jgi:hypothetical protein
MSIKLGQSPLVVINFDQKFQSEVVEAIENAISVVWGKDVAQVIFYNFSKDNSLARDEIVRRPELFEATLETIFGETGSKFVRKKIIEKISTRFQLSKEESGQISTTEQAIRLAWRARNKLHG